MDIQDQNPLYSLRKLLKRIRNISLSKKGNLMGLMWNEQVVRLDALIDVFCDCKKVFLNEIQDPVKVYVDRINFLIKDRDIIDEDSACDVFYLLTNLEFKLQKYVIYPALQSYYNFPVTSEFLKSVINIQRKKKPLQYPLNNYLNVAYDPERKRLFLKCQKVMKGIDRIELKKEDKPSFMFLKELNTEWWECMIGEHTTLISFLKDELERIRKSKTLEEKICAFDDMVSELRVIRAQYPSTEDDLPSFLGIRVKKEK